jgi:phosphatidylserine/phosphatidylglycerophosphate/cardiolipin synthase-like enzyme
VKSVLHSLNPGILETLERALSGRRLVAPYTATGLARHVPGANADALATELVKLDHAGMTGPQIALLIDAITEEKRTAEAQADRIELVWTGPETTGSRSRDTAAVARELFSTAESSVLVTTFAIYQGSDVFKPLADRMVERPALRVRLFLNVMRPSSTSDDDSTITRNFLKTFRKKDWPWEAVPEVYYEPRSLAPNAPDRSVLHAKCIVADDRRVFVTSANFTEAAHERNIEAGLLLDNATIAQALTRQFETLVHAEILKRLFL